MLAPIDFIRIVQKLWQYDVIRSFSQTREASFSDVQHNIHKTIRSTNKLLGGYKYSVLGLKTGTTNAA
ncbi:MAG: hypothetical protein U9Q15_05465 [Patescibacteria group bacterium]|nr:hypothetical protein [Patescibacteria group bacterium]